LRALASAVVFAEYGAGKCDQQVAGGRVSITPAAAVTAARS
jgi:hypothetical protein